jgi:hypothetical protein
VLDSTTKSRLAPGQKTTADTLIEVDNVHAVVVQPRDSILQYGVAQATRWTSRDTPVRRQRPPGRQCRVDRHEQPVSCLQRRPPLRTPLSPSFRRHQPPQRESWSCEDGARCHCSPGQDLTAQLCTEFTPRVLVPALWQDVLVDCDSCAVSLLAVVHPPAHRGPRCGADAVPGSLMSTLAPV